MCIKSEVPKSLYDEMHIQSLTVVFQTLTDEDENRRALQMIVQYVQTRTVHPHCTHNTDDWKVQVLLVKAQHGKMAAAWHALASLRHLVHTATMQSKHFALMRKDSRHNTFDILQQAIDVGLSVDRENQTRCET